jgi:short subunit dehydrogenase-like uncharacterized protein
MEERVVVYGATGHTGRFVVADLVGRGIVPVLSGRDPATLAELGAAYPGAEVRLAVVDDPTSLDDAFRGAAAVVNCAGPFLDTAGPVAATAVRAGAHYLDVTAEQAVVQQLYATYADGTAVAVLPATAFYGGLADLLATAATDGWDEIDDVTVVIGLDRWWPTEGTRVTGHRNTATRLVVEDGRLVPVPVPARDRDWSFPGPVGPQRVVGVPFSETVVIAHHLPVRRVETYLAAVALADVRDPRTPEPEAVDPSGRSAQQFVVEVVVRRGAERRRWSASGQDIYAVTAPLVGEAVERLLTGRSTARGAAALGEAFDAAGFLAALSPEHLTIARS